MANKKIDVTKKNNVKKFREDRIWTLAQLAIAAKLTPQTVSKVEQGLASKRHTRLKICKAFGAAYEEVFGEDVG